jgi:hypothetical protein
MGTGVTPPPWPPGNLKPEKWQNLHSLTLIPQMAKQENPILPFGYFAISRIFIKQLHGEVLKMVKPLDLLVVVGSTYRYAYTTTLSTT